MPQLCLFLLLKPIQLDLHSNLLKPWRPWYLSSANLWGTPSQQQPHLTVRLMRKWLLIMLVWQNWIFSDPANGYLIKKIMYKEKSWAQLTVYHNSHLVKTQVLITFPIFTTRASKYVKTMPFSLLLKKLQRSPRHSWMKQNFCPKFHHFS